MTLKQKLLFYIKAMKRLEIINRSASLSFFTAVSIFPMIVVVVFVTSLFFSAEALQNLLLVLEENLPLQSALVSQNILAIFEKRKSIGWINIAALLLSAQVLYMNLEKNINFILHTQTKRHFLLNRLFFFVWLFAMVLVIFSPVLMSFLSHMFPVVTNQIAGFTKISGHVSFVLTTFFMFCVILLILPRRRLGLTRMLKAGFSFALVLQGGKLLFKWFVFKNASRYNLVYGSLSSIFLIMLWIFYFYNVFLFFVYWAGRKNDPVYLSQKAK